ncbi:MAG: tryptophan 7-halogenase [Alphaproteobacteria bacterium]|nr:MAG: tryptophan 7-halogenase [Alphaproteobacteria bacterium]
MRVLVLGGGTAGWMAAAVLARGLGPLVHVSLLESPAIGTVGVGEATIPQIRHLNRFLGITDAELLAASEGTIKLGIRFIGWGRPGESYIHAFSDIGVALGQVGFHHYWLRARAAAPDRAGSFWDYSPNALAAAAGRFLPQEEPLAPGLTGLRWAYHFDAGLYAGLLRRKAEEAGVRHLTGLMQAAERDPHDGRVVALRLDDGRRLEAEFFIDCSGFRSLLLGQALAVPFVDWSQWLACDTALAVGSRRRGPPAAHTEAHAHAAGWRWRIPLRHRIGNGYVYCSSEMDEEAARRALLAALDGEPLGEPRLIRFKAGRRQRVWEANVVALGLAAGFLEPLESTSIHLVQSGLQRLLEMWPRGKDEAALRAEYNRRTAEEWEAIRDFLILHYHRNDRSEPFWRQLAGMTLPEGLAERIALFAQSARIYPDPLELFTEIAWLQVLLGQGVQPRGWHPAADLVPMERLLGYLGQLRERLRRAVRRMPDHEQALARIMDAHAAAD